MNQDELLRLIDGIYDAAGDIARWPTVLERIADAFGAGDASLSAVSPNAVPWLVAPRSDPSFLASYGAYYHPRNLFWRSMSRLPAGTVATDRMVLPEQELQASEFYNDWSAPQGYLAVMGATLFVEDDVRVEFVVPGKRDFGPAHLKLYETLAPHLMRAVQLNQRLARAEIERDCSIEALDRLEQGVLIVDGEARVLFANRAADAVFAAGFLRLQDGVLRARLNGATPDIHRLIAGCVRGSLEDAGGYVSVQREPDQPSLSLLIVPVRADMMWPVRRKPAAIVFISDPECAGTMQPVELQRRFGLTPAEAALALELTKGDGMQATADRLGIRIATARTHLHRVLRKTGTTRQADLVRLVLAGRHGVRRD